MNLDECVEILSGRKKVACNCNFSASESGTNEKRTLNETDNVHILQMNPISQLECLSTLELLNALTSLQGERVQTYIDFDSIFSDIIERSELDQYPFLCAEVSSRFQVISNKIREIKGLLENRKLHILAKLVGDLQALEKGKLTLVASLQLDKIQERRKISVNQELSLFSEPKYAQDQLKVLESKVADLIESIQAEKCDLI